MNDDTSFTSSPVDPSIGRSTMHRDLMAAYVGAGSRIGSWAVVSAVVYRVAGPTHFATLALMRGTIGILNYTAVGLSPALIRLFAGGDVVSDSPQTPDDRAIFSTGVFVASISAILGVVIAIVYAHYFTRWHVVPASVARQAPLAVVFIGVGTLLRLFSDSCGAWLQTRRRIALDNYLSAGADICWAVMTTALWPSLLTASITYAAAGVLLVVARSIAVAEIHATPWPPTISRVRWTIARRLLSFGGLVLLAQLAEYFYAPTDYILINHFFGPADVAAYAPGVQIDLGLLMLVTALAAVLLPKSALAHTAGNQKLIRRYYLFGTLASTLMLVVAASAVWLLYPIIFRLWFGPHPPDTHAVLDLILIGTVIGGSSAVGRSILIGTGKIKAFTVAAIIAGIVNAMASFCFAKYTSLGLRGILYGTLIAVIARCGLWMPWYVLKVVRESDQSKLSTAPTRRTPRKQTNG